MLDAIHEPRVLDRSVPYIYATLLGEGIYHGSVSTMYRTLHSVGEVGERRDPTRPAHVKPELCATAPRQVFAWDITKLHGPQKWTYFYLYTYLYTLIARASRINSIPPVNNQRYEHEHSDDKEVRHG